LATPLRTATQFMAENCCLMDSAPNHVLKFASAHPRELEKQINRCSDWSCELASLK
jgi:hypothetical protein